MSYTKFGEIMRLLRVKHHEVMGDIAELLSTTTPYLSAVENGKKNVPDKWIPIIAKHYSLSTDEVAELKTAIEESRTQMKINMAGSGNMQRKVAVQFARSFDGIDDDTALKIMKLLEGEN